MPSTTHSLPETPASRPRRLGVCSWSLCPPDGPDGPEVLARRVTETGVRGVQLALEPLRVGGWTTRATLAALADRELELLSGMMSMHGEDYTSLASIARTGGVRPDEHWSRNLAAARANAKLAAELGLELVTFHAGFLPEAGDEPERSKLLERLRAVVDAFGAHDVRVAFESGQESAANLTSVLDELDRPNVGVNFDPANMLLYDRDEPLAALGALGARVLQVHVKDARRTRQRGTWGEEVVAGTGEVPWREFFAQLDRLAPAVDLVIEREAGDDRVGDIRRAATLVEAECEGVR